jgi:hypothetical protein
LKKDGGKTIDEGNLSIVKQVQGNNLLGVCELKQYEPCIGGMCKL